MSKDGSGGEGGYSYGSPSKTISIHDVHIATLKLIDSQLARLHATLDNGDGDDDVTQEQITQLQEELVRLSKVFSDAEVRFLL